MTYFNWPNQLKMAEYCCYKISRVLSKRKYRYLICYSGKSIEITSKSEAEYTRIYCRVINAEDHFELDISNIELDKSIRHKGIFTAIVNEFRNSYKIKQITVSSVLTEEMHSACRKLGMQVDERIQGYRLKIRDIHTRDTRRAY